MLSILKTDFCTIIYHMPDVRQYLISEKMDYKNRHKEIKLYVLKAGLNYLE